MRSYSILLRCSLVLGLINIATARQLHERLPRYAGKRSEAALATPLDTLELAVDTLKCPQDCNCQYAHFKELSISRWVHKLQRRRVDDEVDDNDETYNEAYDDEFQLLNPLIKQATCILQADSDAIALINSLPMDLQSLKLLYTGVQHEMTLNTSSLAVLNQLSTLEIHGANTQCIFRLIIDAPLSFLQHANFEQIQLLGSEKIKQPKNPRHPRDIFDYKPPSERYEATKTSGGGSDDAATHKRLDFELEMEAETEENEILPYHVYKIEVKKSRMPTFYGWTALEVLRIHACQLSELQWEIFNGLTALQHLSLEHNAIELLPPFALFGALHIKNLSLAHNRLHKLHYHALAGLLELVELDLSDNRLVRLSELTFPPFPKMERIDFRNNPIRYIFPATFWIMNDTSEMYFGSTETALELWGNEPFDSLHRLSVLSLGNVSISNLDQGIFKGLRGLDSLTIRGDIRTIEFDAFADLRKLRRLDLSHCNIQEISMDALMGCKQLEMLNLAYNNISYIPPGLFDETQQLQDIYLEYNQLRALPRKFFLQPKLRLTRLNNNPWHCTCDMSNWLPKLTNAVRGESIERCITDTVTGKRLSCRRIENFEHNKNLAPRCANYNGRSVYYVVRKQLDCAKGRMLRQMHTSNNSTPGRPHWLKVQLAQEKKMLLINGKFSEKRFKHKIEPELESRMWANTSNKLQFTLQQQQQKQEHDSEWLLTNEI